MRKRKLLSIILAFCVTFSVGSFSTFAEETDSLGIIKNTWTAKPGDAIGIYGANFGDDATQVQVLLLPMSGYHGEQKPAADMYSLEILNLSDGVIQAGIPTNIPKDDYVGFVKKGQKFSKPFFINTPEVDWVADKEICESQTVRAFGRNFLNPKTDDASNVKVFLCDTSDETVLEAAVKNVTSYTIDFVVPEGVITGKDYIIKVSNGACEYGVGTLDNQESVKCLAKGEEFDFVKNNYGIELGWASELNLKNALNVKDFGAKGDGKTDDVNAVLSALSKLESDGGGILYFPQGEYNLEAFKEGMDSSGKEITNLNFNMPNKSVLTGDGKDKTIFLIDERMNFTCNYSGMYNIGIHANRVRAADDNRRLTGGVTGSLLYINGENTHFFGKQISMVVKDGSSVISYSNSHVAIEDSSFDITHQGPAFYNMTKPYISMRLRFINNYVRNTQRSLIWLGGHSWVENCVFEGDNGGDKCEKNPQTGIVGAMEHRITEMWGDKIFYGNNHIIGTVGDQREGTDDNCGEGICNQAANRIARSTVKSAAESTLTDTDKDFDAILKGNDSVAKENGKLIVGAKIAITSGAGLGQVRKITNVSGNTITIDKPWDVIPKIGDAYIIDGSIAEKYIIVNNNVEAKTRKGGIMLYNMSYDNVIDKNVLTNSGGIWFGKAFDYKAARHAIAYFNYVANNALSGGVMEKSGGKRDKALSIGTGDDGGVLTAVDPVQNITSQYANMYKNNTIIGTGKEITIKDKYHENFVKGNGIVISTQDPRGINYPFSKGMIVENNSVTNSMNGVTLSETSYDTLLYKNDFKDNTNDYNDSGSVKTATVKVDEVVPAVGVVKDEDKPSGLTDKIMLKVPNLSADVTSGKNSDGIGIKTFDDIQDHWARKNIEALASTNLVKGMSETQFAPDNNITRAEFITLIMRALKVNDSGYKYRGVFSDVPEDAWYAGTVETALSIGLIDNGMLQDQNLDPERPISREEIASIIVRALEYKNIILEEGDITNFNDVGDILPWANSYMKKAYNIGIIAGNDEKKLLPDHAATRAEAVTMLKRFLDKI